MRSITKEELKLPQSPFNKFCMEVKGYQFFNQKGNELDKWEVFYPGINVEKLLNNKTKVVCKLRK